MVPPMPKADFDYTQLLPSTVPPSDPSRAGHVIFKGKLEIFDEKKLLFGRADRKKYGGKHVRVSYGEQGHALVFQTPVMRVPFGLTVYNNTRGESVVMELGFADKDLLVDEDQFFTELRRLDAAVLAAMKKRRETWCAGVNPSYTKDGELWRHFTATTRKRESKQHDVYPPRMTLKVWGDAMMTGCKGGPDEKKPIDITKETIFPQCWVRCIVECTGIWCSGDSVSIGYKLVKGRLEPAPVGIPVSKAEGAAVDFIEV
jgi:hypothetical protein